MTSNNLKITLKDNVYRQVIEMICNGQLQNDDIITEKQLTSHFGISKSPVREALIQLCHDHVLKVFHAAAIKSLPSMRKISII